MTTKASFKLDETVPDLFQIFRLLDFNKDEILDIDDLTTIFKRLNFQVSEKEIKTALKQLCENQQSPRVTFPIFLSWFKKIVAEGNLYKNLSPVFELLDINEDSYVSGQELIEIVGKLGEKISYEEAQAIIGEKIDFEQFVALASKFLAP